MLADGHGRHAVPVAGPDAFGFRALKTDVDGVGAQLALPLDVSLPALDNIGVFGVCHAVFGLEVQAYPKNEPI